MSKAQLLSIAHLNFFANTKPQVTFLKGKNTDGSLDKVQADFSGWEQEKGIDMKAINATSKDGTKKYIRVAITLSENGAATYYNGALFPNTKKQDGDTRPDMTGTLDLTKTQGGPQLQLAVWNKNGRETGTPFFSMAITDKATAAAAPTSESASVPVSGDADVAADLPAEVPF